ncbi:ZmpA/ZmpB/ZmpC family metallo-endopeptidase [Inconstantimicrobium porci]|uniref:ZmpA/ZmpB/ZmpC family metallo-endopeptidase n=1 Tax=Inconstantimicrobium porci TaxID=2652291 RepID=UPI00240A6133|nr:ZmpA/ZmpB/ZmpC family metallo-endopeptidase [Inconstantimicrobium porci]MDD6771417.1 ZmpA/ZmpB/ZmpC family metallo-endopeptidase [Inconstantimicrobium porci]
MMKEIIDKKKKEKRVVKYALRKYTVGLVSVAISTSIFAPVAVSANTLEIGEGNIVVSKEAKIENNLPKDTVLESDKVEAIANGDEFLSDADAEKMIDEVIDLYNAIQYEDLYDILKPYEKGVDRFNIINELRKQLGREPSEDEIKKALKTFYMDKIDLEEAFNKVKANLRQELKQLITKTSYVQKNNLIYNKDRILLGLTYLEKQYSFKFGDKTAKDLILYNSGLQGDNHNALFYLIGIGNVSYSDLELRYNLNTYKKNIAPITGKENILDFIEGAVKAYAKENTAKEWFENSTKAWIVESESKYGTSSIYEKMAKDERLKSHLIPLLLVGENSIYAISTMSSVTYGVVDAYIEDTKNASIDDLKADMEKTAKKQQLFLDFWYRISSVNNKLLESKNIIVVDSLLDYGKADATGTLWSKETGKDALKGVREFITPLGLYTSFMRAEGQAGPDNSVNYFLSKALTDRGQETYTHELTHLLDKVVFLNGYGRREGKGAETYARGLFEIVNNAGGSLITQPIFNLNLSYELGDERIQNKSPEMFKTEADLQKYMQGLMDVIYTLDYVEAMSSLNKTAEDKAILYNQLELTDHSTKQNVVNDTFKNISNETAEKLKTVDDLIDNNIVSGRLAFQGILTTGTAEDNGYYVVPLFEPIYAAMQNDKGAVGDISFKRNAYELLAQYGYSKGMAAYISNQYANDKEALNAILDTKYNGNLAEFKKEMFALRASRLTQLKQNDIFADYEELQNLMNEAVEKDLEAMRANKKYGVNINQGVGAVKTLKTQILKSYLKSTDDFTTSIYKDIVVGEKVEVSENVIKSTVVNKTDDTMWEGETRTEQGTDGIEKVTKVWKTENGVPVGEPTITTEIVKEMKPTIIYTGTKKKPQTEVKPDTPGNDDNTQNKPVLPPTEVKPEAPDTPVVPEAPGTGGDSESKPDVPTVPDTPVVPDDEVVEKPSEPENKPETPETEAKPEKPGTDVKPEKPGTDVKPEKPGTDVKPEKPGTDVKPEKPENNSQVIDIDKGQKVTFDKAKPNNIKIVSNKLANKSVDYIVVNGVKITKPSLSRLKTVDTLVDNNDEYYTVTDGGIVLFAKLFETLKLSPNSGYDIGVAFTDGEEIAKLTTIDIVDTSNNNNTNNTVKPSTDSNSGSTVIKPSVNNSTGNSAVTNKDDNANNSNSGSAFTYGKPLETTEETDSTGTTDIAEELIADSENEVADSSTSESVDNDNNTTDKADNNESTNNNIVTEAAKPHTNRNNPFRGTNNNIVTEAASEKTSKTGIVVAVIAVIGAISAAVGVILSKKKK